MGVTGRYDFPGIQKAMGALINGLLAATTWGASLLAGPFGPVIVILEGWIDNWLANKGLIILNVGVNIVDGQLNQDAMDKALDAGIQKIMQGRNLLTPAQGKAIDDAVEKAFDTDADLDAVDTAGVRDVSDTSV